MRFYLRAISYFRPDRWLIGLLLVLIAGSIGLSLLQAWPMAILVDAVLTPQPRAHTWIHRLFLAPLPHDNKIAQVIGVTIIGMGMKIMQDTISMVRTMINNKLRYNGTQRARIQLFGKLQNLGMDYHKSQPQGDAIYRLSQDTFGFYGIIDTIIATSVALVMLVVMTLIMLSRSVPLTVFALSAAIPLMVANIHFARRIKHRAAEAKAAESNFTAVVQRLLTAIGLIQAFGRQTEASKEVKGAVEHSFAQGMKLNWQEALYPLARDIIFAMGGAIIFGYGGYLVYRDQFVHPIPTGVTVGDLMVFMVYLGQMWDPLSRVASFNAAIQTHSAAARRVFHVLDQTTSITDAPDAIHLSPTWPMTLSLENVSFAYPNNPDNLILKGVSAEIDPGQFVAFVGESGSGKSTLLNLLARFYDPISGCVKLDGYDLRKIKVDDVRQHVTLVSQDNLVLPTTIAENIRFGAPDATDEEVHRVAVEAGAARFIKELPDGYDTVLTEGGANLSGGQRQRIAIARALLTYSPIIALDEPTSALDPQTTNTVLSTIRGLHGERTVVLVTHHLAAVIAADQIYVLKSGRIVENGTHEQLLAERGAYWRMWISDHPPDDERAVPGIKVA